LSIFPRAYHQLLLRDFFVIGVERCFYHPIQPPLPSTFWSTSGLWILTCASMFDWHKTVFLSRAFLFLYHLCDPPIPVFFPPSSSRCLYLSPPPTFLTCSPLPPNVQNWWLFCDGLPGTRFLCFVLSKVPNALPTRLSPFNSNACLLCQVFFLPLSFPEVNVTT